MKTLVVKQIKRSIEIMDEFDGGDFDYLELNDWLSVVDSYARQYSVYDNSGRLNISLMILQKSIPNKRWCNSEPTMTELRQMQHKRISLDIDYPEDSMFGIIKEACKIWKVNEFIELPMNICLRAQTSYNRMDYGCEWLGGGDWEEKTLYGETTDFYIVGIILHEPFKHIEQEAIEILQSLKIQNEEDSALLDSLTKKLASIKTQIRSKKWDTGTIKHVEAGRIIVDFSGKEVKFLFPDSFIQGFLVADTAEELVSKIKEISETIKHRSNEISKLENAMKPNHFEELYDLVWSYRENSI